MWTVTPLQCIYNNTPSRQTISASKHSLFHPNTIPSEFQKMSYRHWYDRHLKGGVKKHVTFDLEGESQCPSRGPLPVVVELSSGYFICCLRQHCLILPVTTTDLDPFTNAVSICIQIPIPSFYSWVEPLGDVGDGGRGFDQQTTVGEKGREDAVTFLSHEQTREADDTVVLHGQYWLTAS